MPSEFDFNSVRMNAVRTAENGVVNADTVFTFRQVEHQVFAEYSGGGVIRGHLVGLLEGARLSFRYAQLERGDILNGGHSLCEVERTTDGRLRLVEHFEWESRPGGGTNVIEELPALAGASDGPVDWRALFERRAERNGAEPPRFCAPAREERLAELERELGLTLPAELRVLLATSDGVRNADGGWLVWNVATLVEENRRFRRRTDGLEGYMAFDELFFFSDAPGNGDAFAYRLLATDGFQREDIFLWDHEDDSRTHSAEWLRTWAAEAL